MEISALKTKLMSNSTSGIDTKSKVNGQKLKTAISFKYLGSELMRVQGQIEILFMLAKTMLASTRLKPVWNDRSISFSSKI